MAAETASPQRYAAVHLHDGQETLLGTILLAPSGMIAVESEAPGLESQDNPESRLSRIARTMNDTDAMYIDVPPPDDAPQFTLTSEIIRRGDPDFIPALKTHLSTYYGVELRRQ